MICKGNNNSYHEDASAFFRCFFEQDPHLNVVEITDTKLYVPAVTLSTQDNTKLLQQFKSGFKIIISWNKCLPKVSTENQNPYLDYLIDLSLQGVNKPFVLSFEDNAHLTRHTEYFFSKRRNKRLQCCK